MLQSWHSLLISLAELETGLCAFLVIFEGSNSVKTNLVGCFSLASFGRSWDGATGPRLVWLFVLLLNSGCKISGLVGWLVAFYL